MTPANKSIRIYVPGHRGMVGSAIVRALPQRGYTHILTRSHGELDLCDQSAVQRFFQDNPVDYVLLAAAKVGGIHANNSLPAQFIYENLMIAANVIHASFQAGVRRLMFLGSSCIYPKMAPQPLKESHLLTGPLEPTNEPYAVAKIAGIKLCNAYNRQYGTRYFAVMPTNLYGPNDNYDLENSHVLPALIRKFHLAKLAANKDWGGITRDEQTFGPIPEDIRLSLGITEAPNIKDPPEPESDSPPSVLLWGSGKPYREFLHVDDLADACVFLMEKSMKTPNTLFRQFTQDDNGLPLPMINIGCGDDLTILDLARMVRRIVGFSGDVIWDASKPDGTPRKRLNVSIISSLGWKPGISLTAGIEHTYQAYLNKLSY